MQYSPQPWPTPPLEHAAYVGPGGREGSALSLQDGVIALRPRRVAFIAAGRAVDGWSLLGRAALGAAGFVNVGGASHARRCAEEMKMVIDRLQYLSPWDLDAAVPSYVEHYGGMYLTPEQAPLTSKKLPLGERLYFDAGGGMRVHVGFPARVRQNPMAQALLDAWR